VSRERIERCFGVAMETSTATTGNNDENNNMRGVLTTKMTPTGGAAACGGAANAQPEKQPPQKRRKMSNKDRVQIDVGGTVFITSKTTLTLSSSYFASKFKAEWGDGDEDDDGDEPLFVDQDPVPFAILLGFMREGFVKKSQLTEKVLAQAEFFGIDLLLMAAMSTAFRALHPAERHLSDDEACVQFGEEYGGVLDAIRQGILPKSVKESGLAAKQEYAVVCRYTRRMQAPGFKSDYFQVKVRPGILDSAGDGDGQAVAVPTCSTLVDALNWLSKNGFRLNEDVNGSEFDFGDYMGEAAKNKCLFSRPVTGTAHSPIVFDHHVCPLSCRVFAQTTK